MSILNLRFIVRPRLLLNVALIAGLGAGCGQHPRIVAPVATTAGGPHEPGLTVTNPSYQVLAFDVPASMGSFTSAFGINAAGVIVGNYAAADLSAHGFLFQRGEFSDITVPGAGPSDHGSLGGINDRGTSVGVYSDADDASHMYTRDPQGVITTYPDPLPGASTDASGIDNQGVITGTVFDASGGQHGFIHQDGVYTLYDHPGATRTRLFKNNNRGQSVGFWFDPARVRHGFILENGVATEVNVPGAVGTGATGINDRGEVVGFYLDAGGVTHGFLLRGGEFTTIDFPGSPDTRLMDINNAGIIVGTYDLFSFGLIAVPDGIAASSLPAGVEGLASAPGSRSPAPTWKGRRFE